MFPVEQCLRKPEERGELYHRYRLTLAVLGRDGGLSQGQWFPGMMVAGLKNLCQSPTIAGLKSVAMKHSLLARGGVHSSFAGCSSATNEYTRIEDTLGCSSRDAASRTTLLDVIGRREGAYIDGSCNVHVYPG